MAVKIEQLKSCIELQYRKEMSKLNDRLNQEEPVIMAAKYIEKLIPDGRKIVLPELRLLAEDDDQDLEERNEIEHQKSNEIEYLKENENILAKYSGYGLEATILGYIHEKTGLHFIKRIGRVHPIVPNTLRELVNLMSVLGKLETSDWLNNLVTFENYFFNTWIPNNLDEGYVIVLRRIHTTDILTMNMTVSAILLDKLENNKLYTLDTTFGIDNRIKFNQIKEYFRNKRFNEISLGDTMELINFFEEYYTDEEPKLFSFALRTLYSLIMNKLSISSPEKLYNFIQGSIWGHKIISGNMSYRYSEELKVQYSIQAEGAIRQSRTYFNYNSREIVFPQSIVSNDETPHLSSDNLNSINKELLSDLLFFSNFNQGFIRRNWSINENPMFNLENLFISSVYPLCVKNKIADNIKFTVTLRDYNKYLNLDILTQIATNVELATFVFEYISKSSNQLHEKEEQQSDHFEKLIYNIDKVLSKESHAHAGPDVSIFCYEGRKWLIETYMRFWDRHITIIIPERDELIPWLENNRLSRTCKVSTFDSRFKVISQILSVHEEKIDNFDVYNIKMEIDKYFAEDQENGDKISRETRNKFNELCNKLIEILS